MLCTFLVKTFIQMWSHPGCDLGLLLRELLYFPICCIRARLFVKLESLGKGDSRSHNAYCKSNKSITKRHYCYKWWETWLYLSLVRIQALQRSLEAASSNMSHLDSIPLQKDLCKCWTCTTMSGQRKKRNQQLAYSAFFPKHCCLYLSSSRFFKLFREKTKHRKIFFFSFF